MMDQPEFGVEYFLTTVWFLSDPLGVREPEADCRVAAHRARPKGRRP